jgi:hypothetical protein
MTSDSGHEAQKREKMVVAELCLCFDRADVFRIDRRELGVVHPHHFVGLVKKSDLSEAEALMGHREAYDKIPWAHLRERYLAAVPHLSIDERFTLREEFAAKEKEHSEAWRDTRLEVLELRDENRAMKETLDRLVPVVERMKELQKEYQEASQ